MDTIKKARERGGAGKSDGYTDKLTESANRERGRLELFTAVLKSDGFSSKRRAGSSSLPGRGIAEG